MNMKLPLAIASALISCCVGLSADAGVVIGGSYGIAPGKGKPVVTAVGSVDLGLPNAGDLEVSLKTPTGTSTLAAGFTLPELVGNLTPGSLTTGVVNVYKFTVGSCIDSFVSSVLFEENIVGLKFSQGVSAGIGVFVLGVEGKRLSFAGYSPFSNGFEFEIYTAGVPAIPATATPEPSTLLVWGGLVALCGATRPVRRLFSAG